MTMLSAEIFIFISSHVLIIIFLYIFLLSLLLSGPQFITGANGFNNNEQSLSMF